MNLLTSLVPGLRDLRRPLAVGLLWIVLIWLWLPELPGELTDSEVADRARGLAQDAGPVGAAGVIAFGSYILGLTMETLSRFTLAILLAAIALFPLWVPALVVAIASANSSSGVTGGELAALILLAAVVVAIILFWRFERRRAGSTWTFRDIIDTEAAFFEEVLCAARLIVIWVASLGIPGRRILNDFVGSHIADLEPVELDIYDERLQSISAWHLRDIARLSRRHFGGRNFDSAEQNLNLLILKSYASEDAVRRLRELIAAEMQRSPSLRRRVYLDLVNPSEWRKMARQEMASAATQLRAHHEGLFSDYDRERAEAEFRIGVSVPMTLVSGSLIHLLIVRSTVTSTDGRAAGVLVATVVGLTVGGILFGQGLRKKSSADSMILSSLRSGVVAVSQPGFNDPRSIRVANVSTIRAAFEVGRGWLERPDSYVWKRDLDRTESEVT